jgi:hypothetical protein
VLIEASLPRRARSRNDHRGKHSRRGSTAAPCGALAGLDAGELITIPSPPDAAQWDAFQAARETLVPHMSRREPAERYRVSAGA